MSLALNKRLPFLTLLIFLLIKGEAQALPKSSLQEGYYALPFSQQPGPLISFGQSLIEAKRTQLIIYPSYLKTNQGYYFESIAFLVYGITDNVALQFTLPLSWNVQNQAHSSGLEDINLQLEYGFYQKNKSNYQDQATIVTALNLPSGSPFKNPPTGYGAFSFFEGLTFARTYQTWSWFLSSGALLTTSQDAIHYGSSYYYQLGLNYLLASRKDKYIFNSLLEVDGQYSQKNHFKGVTDANSGGNLIYLTPSLSFSTQRLILQAGVSFPLLQKPNGSQDLSRYDLVLSLVFTFN